MKRRMLLLAGAVMLLTAVGCSKQKNCRCAVRGTSTVRIITIERGECAQLKVFQYNDALDSLHVDSLVCTDYEFDIDHIYNK